MLRLWVHQSCFFNSSPYVGWSIFVFLLVVLAIQEQATKKDSNSSYLRTAQSLRILTELRSSMLAFAGSLEMELA